MAKGVQCCAATKRQNVVNQVQHIPQKLRRQFSIPPQRELWNVQRCDTVNAM